MRYWSVIVVGLLLFTSCKNDVSKDIVETSRSKTLAQYLFLDAFRQTIGVVPEFVAEGLKSGAAVTITTSSSFDNSAYPKTVTIDYGSVNQQDEMGINRRGKILVSVLSNKITKGDFKITFDKFYFNDTRMLGTLSSSFVGSISSDDYSLVLEESCKISNANGTMSLSGTMSLKMTEGNQSIDVFDDVYLLTEKTSGLDFSGDTYSANSTTGYTLDFSCRWIVVAGSGEVNPNDIAVQKLNFGSGSCDGIVTAEVGKDDFIGFQVK
ncbi:MAG: hypothetical protein ACJA0Q_001943 [Saprospiraceae bacterium]|jgi:hypothetical protein